MSKILILVFAAFLLGLALTWCARWYAVRFSVLDNPVDRSSHTLPTPRGGGIAFVVTFLLALVFFGVKFGTSLDYIFAVLGGGSLVALIGALDDHRHVSGWLRFLMHTLAALWALYWLGGFPAIDIGVVQLQLGWLGSVLAALGIVWMINLYNFMDGIDGLAGGQAVTASLGASVLLWISGAQGLTFVMVVLAAAGAGFLIWNWAPAKIFMGDVGSGFLGFVFAVTAIASENAAAVPLLVWLILLLLFIGDATLTLIKRILIREKWYTAHRTHAYQRLVTAGYSHQRVVVCVFMINGLVFFPLAYFCVHDPQALPWVFAILVLSTGVIWAIIQRWFKRLQDTPRTGRVRTG